MAFAATPTRVVANPLVVLRLDTFLRASNGSRRPVHSEYSGLPTFTRDMGCAVMAVLDCNQRVDGRRRWTNRTVLLQPATHSSALLHLI